MSSLDDLIRKLCPDGVPNFRLSALARFEKGSHLSDTDFIEGPYAVVTASRSEARKHAFSNTGAQAVTVTSHGAYAGHVNFWPEPIWLAGNVFLLKPNPELITPRYLFYVLKESEAVIQGRARGGGIPYMNASDLSDLVFQIPPLEIQKEIVSILDKFTDLEAELEAELEARRTQYEVTRDRLLDFSGDLSAHPMGEKIRELCPHGVNILSLAEVLDVIGGFAFQSSGFNSDGKGLRVIRIGDVNADRNRVYWAGDYPSSSLIQSGDLLISLSGDLNVATWTSGPALLNQRVAKLSPREDLALSRYIFHYLKLKINNLASETSMSVIANLSISALKSFPISMPPLEIQKEIVSILDKLDDLVNDISYGLPAEIAVRRKQYEYYRNKLLTFKEMDAA